MDHFDAIAATAKPLLRPGYAVATEAINITLPIAKSFIKGYVLSWVRKRIETEVFRGDEVSILSLCDKPDLSSADLDATCRICWDEVNNAESGVSHNSCGNLYHRSCLNDWLRSSNPDRALCIVCRRPLSRSETTKKIDGVTWNLDVLERASQRAFKLFYSVLGIIFLIMACDTKYKVCESNRVLKWVLDHVICELFTWALAWALIEFQSLRVRYAAKKGFSITRQVLVRVLVYGLLLLSFGYSLQELGCLPERPTSLWWLTCYMAFHVTMVPVVIISRAERLLVDSGAASGVAT